MNNHKLRCYVWIPTAIAAASIAWGASAAPAQSEPQAMPVDTKDTPLPPAIVLPGPPNPPPPDVPATPITADLAAIIALRHQPGITAAAGQLEAAAGYTKQSRAGLLPSVVASAGYTESKIVKAAGTSTSISSLLASAASSAKGPDATDFIELRQLLFDFGHTSNLAAQASALETASSFDLTSAQANTVLTVKQDFYNLAQTQRLVGVNEDNYRAQYQHLAEARARQVAGIGLVSDVVQAQTAVSDAALQLNIARNNDQIARVTLALAMGLDPRTPIQAADSDEAAPNTSDLNALVADALRNRPEVRAASASVKAAQAAVSAARTSILPSISGVVGYAGKDTEFPPNGGSVAGGLVLSVDPFDSGLTAGKIKQARGELLTAQANLTSAEQSVSSDVAQAYLNTLLADQRVSTANDEVTNALEAVHLAEGRFRAGIAIFLEVTDAQAALVSARTNLVNARSSMDQARAALSHAIGPQAGR